MVAHLVDCHLIYLWGGGGLYEGFVRVIKKTTAPLKYCFCFERGNLEEPGEKLREPTNSSHEVRRVRNRTQDRRRLQRKGRFKVELRMLLFSRKKTEWKIYCCGFTLLSEPQLWKVRVVVWQTTSKKFTKSELHVQHDYFPLFSQS